MGSRRKKAPRSDGGPGPRRTYTDQMEEQATTRSLLAARYLGLTRGGSSDSSWECPIGGHHKMRIFEKGCHCHSCGKAVNAKDAIWMLVNFGRARGLWDHDPKARGAAMARAVEDAILLLNGRPAPNSGVEPFDIAANPDVLSAPPREFATCDVELYQAILTAGRAEQHGLSAAAAADHYAPSGIDPDIAVGSGAVAVVDAAAVHAWLAEDFGLDRCNAAGIRKPDTGYWLLNAKYPYVEPHTHPTYLDGRPAVTSLQFRCSSETKKLVDAHMHAKATGGDTKAHPYVMKFLSLWGPAPDTRAGFGGASLSALSKGSTLLVTEGFKDRCAALTLTRNLNDVGVYGLPGAQVRPPDAVLAQLHRFVVVIAYDPDEGGDAGREALAGFLVAEGNLRPSQVWFFRPEGGDLADATQRMVAAGQAPNLTDGQWRALQGRFEPYLPDADTDAVPSDADDVTADAA